MCIRNLLCEVEGLVLLKGSIRLRVDNGLLCFCSDLVLQNRRFQHLGGNCLGERRSVTETKSAHQSRRSVTETKSAHQSRQPITETKSALNWRGFLCKV
jgi:hypothetical protein